MLPIDDSPKQIDTGTAFGRREIDRVLSGKAEDEPVVVTVVGRELRKSIGMKATDHPAESMRTAIKNAVCCFGERNRDVLKSITAEDGPEFAMPSERKDLGTPVDFTHPYFLFFQKNFSADSIVAVGTFPKIKMICIRFLYLLVFFLFALAARAAPTR